MSRLKILIFAAVFAITGCASGLPAITEGEGLDLRAYFDGPVEAWGVVESRSGTVLRRFHVDLVGTWNGSRGELYEKFDYTDGSSEVRTWVLERQASGDYVGTAGDVAGVAEGRPYGASFRWTYVLEVPYGDGTVKVRLDDRLHRIDDQTVLNRAVMKKFGFTVGYITLAFRKPQIN